MEYILIAVALVTGPIMALSLWGVGQVAIGRQIETLPQPLRALTALCTGLLALTLIAMLLLSLGLLTPAVRVSIASIIVGVAFYQVYLRIKYNHIRNLLFRSKYGIVRRRIWLLGGASLVVLFFLIAKTSSPILHGDAARYHVALPLLYVLSGRFSEVPDILNWGAYLGFDISYVYIPQLANLGANPVFGISAINSYNATIGLLLFPAVYVLMRSLGNGKWLSIAGAGAVLTIESTYRFGAGKNDIIAAAVALIAVAVVLEASSRRSFVLAQVGVALAGYAVAVKLTNAVLVVGFLGALGVTYLCRDHRKIGNKITSGSILAGAFFAPLVPWMAYAYWARGNPIYPVAHAVPETVASLFRERAENGLEMSTGSMLVETPRLLLDIYPVSGNDSIGWLAIVCVGLAVLFLGYRAIKRKWSAKDALCLAALIYTLIFIFDRFEGRFLTRYLLASNIVFIAYAISCVREMGRGRARSVLVCSLIGVAMYSGYIITWPKLTEEAGRIQHGIYAALGKRDCGPICVGNDLLKQRAGYHLYREALGTASGGKVLINDGESIFLDGQFINLHPLHNHEFAREDLTTRALTEFACREDVRVAVIRKGISGMRDVYEEWFSSRWILAKRESGRYVYRRKHVDCDLSARPLSP